VKRRCFYGNSLGGKLWGGGKFFDGGGGTMGPAGYSLKATGQDRLNWALLGGNSLGVPGKSFLSEKGGSLVGSLDETGPVVQKQKKKTGEGVLLHSRWNERVGETGTNKPGNLGGNNGQQHFGGIVKEAFV